MPKFLRSVFACAALLVVATAAKADVLDPPHLLQDLLFNVGPRQEFTEFGSFVQSQTGIGFVAVASSGQPFPSLLATAQIGSSEIPSLFGRASASLDYAFEIVGPAGTIPVDVGAAGFANGIANDGASFAVHSFWRLFDTETLVSNDINSGELTGTFSQAFGGTVGVTLATNHIYGVTMLADGSAAATLAGSHATAEASIDPLFSFGPGVDPTLHSFIFSPGIGNSPAASPVPEPGTLTLLGTGLLCLVRLRRRRTTWVAVPSRILGPSRPNNVS